MTIGNNAIKIDFKKHPFRGILKDVSEKTKRHRQSVKRSYKLGEPTIVKMINKEIQSRMKLVNQSNEETAKILKMSNQ